MRRFGTVVVAIAFSACVAVAPAPAPGPAKSHGHGPPSHAPAHGYRAKTPQGVEVSFDSGLGVYVVLAVPGQYWLDDRYYRRADAGWQISVGAQGPWQVCVTADLPIGLQREGSSNGKSKSKKNK